MEKKRSFLLLDNTYSAADAKVILVNLLADNINMLNGRKYSIREKQGGDTSHIEQRVKELEESIDTLINFCDDCQKSEKRLKVSSKIEIELI